jgi:hypothetical protein
VVNALGVTCKLAGRLDDPQRRYDEVYDLLQSTPGSARPSSRCSSGTSPASRTRPATRQRHRVARRGIDLPA